MGKKLTYEYVKDYIEGFKGYKLLSKEYINAHTKLDIQYNINHVYNATWNDFQQGKRCPQCNTYQYDDVKKFIEDIGYTLLSNEYINCKTKLKIKCNKGHIYSTAFRVVKRGHKCPHCTKLDYNYVKYYFKAEGYTLLSKTYNSNQTKLTVKCSKGHTFTATFAKVQQGYNKCPECIKIQKYKEVKEYIENEKGYKLLSKEYISSQTNLEIQCDKGHQYKVTFNNFKRGQRCPKCNNSKGEKRIESYLNNIKLHPNLIINIKSQKTYNDCKDKCKLKFDFYVEIINNLTNKLSHSQLIEYDGIQHFKPVKRFGGKPKFLKVQHRDNIKNNYVKTNNLNLLRIPYTEFDNINSILDKCFKKYIS